MKQLNDIKKTAKSKGFTLIELMIVIAIIGILAAIAVPQYTDNTRKGRFTEVKLATAAIKKAVETCYELNNGNPLCNTVSASPQIRGQVTDAVITRAENGALVQSVTLAGGAAPVITATAVNNFGLNGTTYVLTGNVVTSGSDVGINEWNESGTACVEGWC